MDERPKRESDRASNARKAVRRIFATWPTEPFTVERVSVLTTLPADKRLLNILGHMTRMGEIKRIDRGLYRKDSANG